jgi:cyclopropane-fatty-acyl-phospholipid synthase
MRALKAGRTRPAPPSLIDRGLRWLFRRVTGDAPLRAELANGTVVSAPRKPPAATFVFRDRRTLLDVMRDPESRFGTAYVDARVTVDGDLAEALEAAYRSRDAHAAPAVRRRRDGRPMRAALDDGRCHDDLVDDFYRLWLGEELIDTSAYFPAPEATLEEAQAAKMELICRKLDLATGERVLEVGCGWGALALHMARRHRVRVRAYTVSREQLRHARTRAWREGLANRVSFVGDDCAPIVGRFDAFVSVGMLQHVGPGEYAVLAGVIDRCLDREQGRGLLHFIGRDRSGPLDPRVGPWILPGAHPPTIAEVIRGVIEPARLAVLDLENLRPHYALTLRRWRERFEAAADPIAARYGERFVRAWRLSLAGSEAAFRTGSLELFQVVFGRPGLTWARRSAA